MNILARTLRTVYGDLEFIWMKDIGNNAKLCWIYLKIIKWYKNR